jgi:hypothetical protein
MLTPSLVLSLVCAFAGDAPGPKSLFVPVEGAVALKMATGKFIINVRITEEGILEVPVVDDGTTLLLTGKAPGKVRLHLTDVDGAKEFVDVVVRRQVAVPLGVALSWPWPARRPVKKVTVDDGRVAHVLPAGGGRSLVRIEALAEGETLFTMSDGDEASETVALLVRKPDRLIAVGESIPLQPASKKALVRVAIAGARTIEAKWTAEGIVTVPGPNPNHVGFAARPGSTGAPGPVAVTGLVPGLARVHLIDADRKEEVIWVGVKPKP